jgi:signal transduction histidine kinase/ligand-binding sensor domain-containing protein/AraC-like DNA-binding protein
MLSIFFIHPGLHTSDKLQRKSCSQKQPDRSFLSQFILLKYFLYIIFVVQITPDAAAQDIRFDHFDTRKGLSQNNVNSLVADSTGYIWVGTIEGLTRFDGKELKIYRPFPGDEKTIRGNIITYMAPGPRGNLWVLTSNGGLNLYDATLERFFYFPDSVLKNIHSTQISSMASPDETLWFTIENKIFCLDPLLKEVSLAYTAPTSGRLLGIDKRTIWFYGKSGIKIMRISTSHKLTFLQDLITTSIKAISDNSNQQVTLISNDQIIQIAPSTLKKQSYRLADWNQNLKENQIISVASYRDEIWLGQYDGLSRVIIHNKEVGVTKFNYDPYNNTSFYGKDATHLLTDKAGNLWIGTSKYGINLLCRENNNFLRHQISILSKADREIDPVRAICKTSDGCLWAGFDRFGLVCTYPDNRQVLFDKVCEVHRQVLPLTSVRSLFEDSRGNFWIGTMHGLYVYNWQTKRIETVTLAFGWKWPTSCYVMKEFDKGILTLTGELGLATVDLLTMKLTLLPLRKKGLLISNSIRGMIRDRDKNLWITVNDGGLVKIAPDFTYKHFTRKTHGLTDNKLYNLTLVNNSLWIASNTGLMEFDITSEKVKASYFETDGLSSNLTYGVVADDSNLWISTNRGLCRFNLSGRHFENFLSNDLFMDDALFKDSEGNIYFGGYDGFISFDPKKICHTSFTPAPGIASLYINNQKVEVGEKLTGRILLPVAIKKLKELKLNEGFNALSLVFDAFPFTYPDRTIFRYRLKGLSSEWLIAGKNENKAVFTSLAPGKYTFQLQSSLNDLTWSNSTELKIEIIPPFWKTMWFRMLMLSMTFLIGLAIFQLRIYTIKRRNILLQKKVTQQTQSIEEQKNKIIAQKDQMVELSNRLHESDQAKLAFYTNISHEFRTPLTLILGNTDALIKQGSANFAIKNISRNAERLYKLVNQFIDLRKYDQGKLKLSVTESDIVAFTIEIADAFREMANQKNITIHLLNCTEIIRLWFDKDKTDKILYNLISNAIKYTGKDGSVVISFQKFTEGVEISVTDTGHGIPEEEQAYIFDSFFRGKGLQSNTDGHGIGLALVKALTDIQNATVNFISKAGHGTTFNILFKWGKDHFKSEDFEETDRPPVLPKEQQKTNIPHPAISNPAGEEILIVEDNEELMGYLISLLGQSYHITRAANGKEALDLLTRITPDLILTDLMMPVMNGIDFCKRLKEKPATMFIPVIILSAKTDIASKIEGLRINVDDYVEKPFHPDLLLLKINNLLSKRLEIKQRLESTLYSSVPSQTFTASDKLFLEKTLILLDSNLSDPGFSMDKLSAALCMSRVTYYRKMKDITGEGPGEFIRKYRLKRAAQMLRNDQKTINQVCAEVGFQSSSHFRQSFKEEFGVLPSEYVKG